MTDISVEVVKIIISFWTALAHQYELHSEDFSAIFLNSWHSGWCRAIKCPGQFYPQLLINNVINCRVISCRIIKLHIFSTMSTQTPMSTSNSKPGSPVAHSNPFSVMSLLSGKQKVGDSLNTLIKPVPMVSTLTPPGNNPAAFTFSPHCAALFTPQVTPVSQTVPHPMTIMNAMAALNGGMVDPATLLMLQSLAAVRNQAMTVMGPSRPAESSPTEMNVSNSSSPQCLLPSANLSNWLTSSTEMSSSSSSGAVHPSTFNSNFHFR